MSSSRSAGGLGQCCLYTWRRTAQSSGRRTGTRERCRPALDGRVVHRMMVTRAMHRRRCSCRGQDKETRRGRRKAASPQDYRNSWQGVEHAWTRARVENAEHTRTCERHDDASICTYPLKGPGACFTPWLPRASCAPSLALFQNVCVCVCVCVEGERR